MNNRLTYQGQISYVFSCSDSPISIEPVVFKHINEIANLNKNWDGHGAIIPNISTLSHVKAFLRNLDNESLSKITEENIFPNPHGTITIRIEKNRNYVNIEFGESYANYYSYINKEIRHRGQKAITLSPFIPYDLKRGLNEVLE